MSVGVSNTALLDLLATTLPKLPKDEFELILTYQKHHALNRWFGKKKKTVESGTHITWNLIFGDSGSYRQVRLYQSTPTNQVDVQKQARVEWTQGENFWTMDTREMRRNRSPAGFIREIESKRKAAQLSRANVLEPLAWKCPNSSTDDLNPFGLLYWASKLIPASGISYDSTIDIDQSFAGRRVVFGAPGTVATAGNSTVTSKAGRNPTLAAEAGFRNYAFTYTAVNADLIKRVRRAIHKVSFEGPITPNELREGRAADFALYMGVDELGELEDMAHKQNDNVGADLDKFHGVTVINRIPCYYAPVLDDDVDDPIIGVDHDQFRPYVMEGDWERENEPMFHPNQHNTIITYEDDTFQFICKNPKEGVFIGHKTLSA